MIRFLETSQVVEEQTRQLELYGLGDPGIISYDRLDSAASSAQAGFGGEYLHTSIYQMGAAYLVRLVKAHAFGNANKRTGLATSLIFLKMNGWETAATEQELIDLVIATATGDGTIDQAEQFFVDHCREDDQTTPEYKEASAWVHARFGDVFARLADM